MGRLTKRQKWIFALQGFGEGPMGMILSGFMLKFYTDILHVDPVLYAFAFYIMNFWNSSNDPFLGYFFDKVKYHPKKGKRLRLAKWSVPFGTVGFFLLILNQPDWPDLALFIVILLGHSLLDLKAALWSINHSAFFMSLTEDPDDRSDVNMRGLWIGFVPMVLVSFFQVIIFDGSFSREFIVAFFAITGIIYFVITSYTLRLIEEPKIEKIEDVKAINPFNSVKDCFKMKSWWFNLFINWGISQVVAFGTSILYILNNVYELKGILLFIPPVIGGVIQPLLLPYLLKLQRKIGFRKMFLIFYSLAFLAYLAVMLVINYVLLCICYVFFLTILSVNAINTCTWGSIPLYQDYVNKGVLRNGTFGVIGGMILIPIAGIPGIISASFLSNYGYVGGAIHQTAEAMIGIRLFFGVIPCIFIMMALSFMLFYPVSQEEYEILQKKVESRQLDTISQEREARFGAQIKETSQERVSDVT